MPRIDLWPEQPTLQAGQIEVGFVLEDASKEPQRFWYRFSSELQPALTDSCDPFVLPAVFIAMQRKANLVVHGQVSPSLLKNLAEFQTIWASWLPGRYAPVEITVDDERECQLKPERGVLASFSGGLDSVFTVWRHHNGLSMCVSAEKFNSEVITVRSAFEWSRLLPFLNAEPFSGEDSI